MAAAFGPCRRCGFESRSKERHIYTTDRAKSFIASRFVVVDLPTKKALRAGLVIIVDAPDEREPCRRRRKLQKKQGTTKQAEYVEGATRKVNGKWSSQIFPGREFDNLDEFRAAKKQRAEQRIAYSDQNIGYRGSSSGKWSSLRHML